MSRQRAGAVLAGVMLAAGWLVGTALPAQAAQLEDAGWWWRANPGQASLTPSPLPQATLPSAPPAPPAPPDVPEGGLLVERGPDGPTAIAAVRFSGVDDGSTATLELQASSTQGAPDLLLCTAGSPWHGSESGRWDSRPLASCDAASGGGSVPGKPGDEGVWTFDVTTLVPEHGELDVVLIPTPAEAGVAAPFRIVFEPVNGSSLQTGSGGSDFTFEGGGGFDAGQFDDPGASAGSFGSPDFGSPGLDLGPGPALPNIDDVPSGGAPAVEVPARRDTPLPIASPAVPDDARATAVAIAVILAGAAVAFVASRQPVPAPHGLVPLRTARSTATSKPVVHVGGVGRFARPRTAPPVRLG